MTSEYKRILKEALKLSEDERELLGVMLFQSIPEDPHYEEYWKEEIARRVKQIKDGTAKMIPWEIVQKNLQTKILRKIKKRSSQRLGVTEKKK